MKTEEQSECIDVDDPYKVLGVANDISKEDLKQHFKRLQFKYHPDMKTGNAQKYLQIVAAYQAIQKNPGIVNPNEFIDLIKNFKTSYVNSEEEKADLQMLYKKYKGDMFKVIDNHLCCEDEDENRLRILIDEMIRNKEIVKYKLYDKIVLKDKRRTAKRLKERKQSSKVDMKELTQLFAENEIKRKQFIEDLEKRYCPQLVCKKETKKRQKTKKMILK
ncbi:hypothetical protein EDEG_03326 [Edhazardia aedis USNM 41457]|uniref:J domain-containing protein n=1 Tax=Edhazardia aedis (strain USNM 41457) TaxID=1003232 RepID=J9DLK3_EDHAE|nr:hypothetical protein EDEG_03326 [Edhazardia aedis USNM 41457]|eukprot:EJW02242.1 hypothetical protein EDEG_03326 [Edhazardia aedis USNM 41457]